MKASLRIMPHVQAFMRQQAHAHFKLISTKKTKEPAVGCRRQPSLSNVTKPLLEFDFQIRILQLLTNPLVTG